MFKETKFIHSPIYPSKRLFSSGRDIFYMEKPKVREVKEKVKTDIKIAPAAPTAAKLKTEIKKYLGRAKRIKAKLSKIPAFVIDTETKGEMAGLEARLNLLEGKLTTLAKKLKGIEGKRDRKIDGTMREVFGLMAHPMPLPPLTTVFPYEGERYKEVRGEESALARTEKGEKYLKQKGDRYVVAFGVGKRGERAERKTKIQHLIPKQKLVDTKILVTGKKHGKGEEARWRDNTWKNVKTRQRVRIYNGNKVRKIA